MRDDRKDNEKEPRKIRRARRTPALALAAVAALATLIITACKANGPATASRANPKIKVEDMFSMAALTPVFGNAKDERSGLSDFTQSDKEIILSYHLYLADAANADKEIARDLAPKIRRLYGHFPRVDRASFEISLPDPVSPDIWKPYVSFALTRKIVKEMGWSDLFDTDLLSAALDIRRTS